MKLHQNAWEEGGPRNERHVGEDEFTVIAAPMGGLKTRDWKNQDWKTREHRVHG